MYGYRHINRSTRMRFGCFDTWNIRLGIIPILAVVFTTLSFVITYIISVSDGHVYPYFPTISNTGGEKPESNVFAVFLSISSFLMFMVMFIRLIQYRHISEYNAGNLSRLTNINKWAFTMGVLACLGALIVAGFQDRGKSIEAHYIGATMVFGFGIIYCYLQTYLSFGMLYCGMNSRRLCILRLIVTTNATIFLVTFCVLLYFSSEHYKEEEYELAKWDPNDSGYVFHVISSISEWLCAGSLLVYYLTFANEFDKIKIDFSVQRHDLNTLPFQTSNEEQRPLIYT